MIRRFAAALAVFLAPALAAAQPAAAPIPLYPGAAPPAIAPEPLPPPAPVPSPSSTPPPTPSPSPPAAAMSPPTERMFCRQPVTVQFADISAVPRRYRRFLGMFSDASWTPQLCAALVVENVTEDGTATILYAFGPMGASANGPGGVLHGTGIVRDGELLFQNSDGSQFAFRPLYADLQGHLTTPRGTQYEAVFKKTP